MDEKVETKDFKMNLVPKNQEDENGRPLLKALKVPTQVPMDDLEPIRKIKAELDPLFMEKLNLSGQYVARELEIQALAEGQDKILEKIKAQMERIDSLRGQWEQESRLIHRLYGIPEGYAVRLETGEVFKVAQAAE